MLESAETDTHHRAGMEMLSSWGTKHAEQCSDHVLLSGLTVMLRQHHVMLHPGAAGQAVQPMLGQQPRPSLHMPGCLASSTRCALCWRIECGLLGACVDPQARACDAVQYCCS